MLSARIVLVRHGQSTWNAEGRLQGQADLPAGPEPSWRGGDLLPPGGERWEELVARVADALEALMAEGGDWLVVTHGGVIRAAVSSVTGADARRMAGPGNAS